jgi:hypothetical protein
MMLDYDLFSSQQSYHQGDERRAGEVNNVRLARQPP